ncbi:MAG: formimidoylglutamate deiminase, partial [Nocardioidaceae bacterium]
MSGATYWCEHAWVGSGPDASIADDVVVAVEDERISAVTVATPPPPGATRLSGLTIPGLANCHSHAFHRALRGRTQRERGTFWTWREQMYAAAARLTPDTYYALSRATYREMAVSGITAVGEFHYLHHGPDGRPYDDPNEMGKALISAATDAGIRIALLDTCYLTAGIGVPPDGVQVRFTDGSAQAWQTRVEALRQAYQGPGLVGAALHSVRAVPRAEMPLVADWAAHHAAPLHLHLSEQVAENDACAAAYGLTPTEVFA